MSVYVDPLVDWHLSGWRRGEWCHMIADTPEELHEMAARIGLRRAWFQAHASHPHYDLRPSKRALAVKMGAVEITHEELVRIIRQKKACAEYTGPISLI